MSNPIADNLPPIDWDLGIRLAGNKPDLAKELLLFLIKNLSADIQAIKLAYENNNLQELRTLVHKLHGATSYCGVPRLTLSLAELTNTIKNKKSIDAALSSVELEAAQVIDQGLQKETL